MGLEAGRLAWTCGVGRAAEEVPVRSRGLREGYTRHRWVWQGTGPKPGAQTGCTWAEGAGLQVSVGGAG